MLGEASRRLAASMRSDDELGRYEEEEFLGVYPGCNFSRAPEVGERMRHAVEATAFEASVGRVLLGSSLIVNFRK